ncbi:MAG TPA: hypothetical protein VNS50_02625 [Ginsengibacter sp.]|nr:hypothetical protein [Ginsengibacter sp.]
MKNLLFFAICLLFFSKSIFAQVSKVIPPDADDFYNKSMPLLRPQVKDIVLTTAKAIENRKTNADSLSKVLSANNALKGISNNDIQGIIVLIMVQASKDADANLKRMVLEISHKNENKKESQEEINEAQNLKLQMIKDRKSDMAEEVSYVMKKIEGSQQNIINNLK